MNAVFELGHNRMAMMNSAPGSVVHVSDDGGRTWVPVDEAPKLPRCPTCGQVTGGPSGEVGD